MKLKSLKVLSLVGLVAAPSASVFAQTTTSPMDMSNFTVGFTAASRYELGDSTANKSMDIYAATAGLRTKYHYKNIFAGVAVQAGSADTTTASSGAATNNTAGQSFFNVTQAYAGMHAFETENMSLGLVMGREALALSTVYAPDGLSQLSTNMGNPNNSSSGSEDGVSIKFKHKSSIGLVQVTLGTYNNLPFAVQSASIKSSQGFAQADSNFSVAPSTQSRAYLAGVSANLAKIGDGSLDVQAGVATQKLAPTAIGSSQTVSGYHARDITDVEASVGYTFKDSIKGGVWFQNTHLGQTNVGTAVTNGEVTYTSVGQTSDSQNIVTMGVGMTGSSKAFGMTGLVEDGDAMTFGLAYQNSRNEQASVVGQYAVGVSATEPVTFNQVNASVGYEQGAYSLALNYVYSHASQEIYKNTDGNVAEKNASLVYLVGAVSL